MFKYENHKDQVSARGWVNNFLKTQLTGLTGNIEKAGYPFDTVRWDGCDFISNTENPEWWVYEQTAYYLDGKLRCAIALNNSSIIDEVSEVIYNVINQADGDGYLGPKFLKKTDGWNRWPHVVFFRAMIALYQYNNDSKIIDALSKHYLNDKADLSYYRDVLNVEIILHLYGYIGNKKLLEKAERIYADYNNHCSDDLCDKVALSDKKPRAHGVSYCEYSKLGAILFLYTKNEIYLKASINAFEKANKFFLLPNGCICSNEFMSGNDYMNSSETCDVSDYTWALHYLLQATKNPIYADRIERCVFNSGIGAVLEDFKGLQYFSCANQIIADENSNHNSFFKGSEWMRYCPNPGTECCAGNVNRFMPNYVLNSWYREENNIYAFLYCASEYNTEINGKKISIIEETDYPIKEHIVFNIKTEIEFNFYFRIPSFCSDSIIKKDGETVSVVRNGSYMKLSIKQDCTIELYFESQIQEHIKRNSIFFTKGCLIYSYGMKGKRKIVTYDKDGFNVYSLYPDKEWRYAVVQGDYRFNDSNFFDGFDLNSPLPYIEINAKVIKNWDFERKNKVRRCYDLYNNKYQIVKKDCVFTPRLVSKQLLKTNDKIVQIRLYPYGACKLRLTVMSLIRN